MKLTRGIVAFTLAIGLMVSGAIMSGVASAGTVKIGLVTPLTGPVAFGGNTLLNGARIAADEINAAGGVAGMKIKIVPEDGACVPPKMANAAEKYIKQWGNDKVLVS